MEDISIENWETEFELFTDQWKLSPAFRSLIRHLLELQREDFRKKAEESVEKSRTVLTSHMGKSQELDNVLLAAMREIAS